MILWMFASIPFMTCFPRHKQQTSGCQRTPGNSSRSSSKWHWSAKSRSCDFPLCFGFGWEKHNTQQPVFKTQGWSSFGSCLLLLLCSQSSLPSFSTTFLSFNFPSSSWSSSSSTCTVIFFLPFLWDKTSICSFRFFYSRLSLVLASLYLHILRSSTVSPTHLWFYSSFSYFFFFSTEPSIRAELAEQLPQIACFCLNPCNGVPSSMSNITLPILEQFLADSNSQVCLAWHQLHMRSKYTYRDTLTYTFTHLTTQWVYL